MRQQVDLDVELRETRGKNASRRLRQEGKVPATLYGLKKDALALAVDAKLITRILTSPAGHNQILNVKVPGGERSASMAVDWQVDPLRGNLLHLDFQRLDLKENVTVAVPIDTIGTAVGVKEQGGFEEVVTREVEVECLPMDVPEKIEIDISELMIGQAIRVHDLAPSDKYIVRSQPDQVLVHIVAPRTVEEAAPAEVEEAAAATEPEVAEKGKGEKTKGEQSEKGKGEQKPGD